MSVNCNQFTPGMSLAGGIIIGIAAAVLILFNGRIAGISGICAGVLRWPRNDVAWRVAFLAGLVVSPIIGYWLGKPLYVKVHAGWSNVLAASFLVGIGTRYASGCTSGHGVCGVSRGSVRSVVTTAVFVATGIVTIFVQRHLEGG